MSYVPNKYDNIQNTNITNIDTRLTTAEGDITTLQTNQGSNDADISQLQTQVAINTSNISANTSNITTNTTNIGINGSNIATNTNDITNNTNAINTLQTNVSNNTTAIDTKLTKGGDSTGGSLQIGTNDNHEFVFKTNGGGKIFITTDGALRATGFNYETLVTDGQTMTNRAFVENITNPLDTRLTTAEANISSNSNAITNQTLTQHADVNITNDNTGDQLYLSNGTWVNYPPNDGQIKANSFNTNLSVNNVLTFLGLTTERDVEYRIPGETTNGINLSSFPTTSIPLNYTAGFNAIGDFYTIGGAAGLDRWIQNPVLGQISEYRIEGSYSGKQASNSGRLQIRIYNPLSSFSFESNVSLAQGITSDEFGISLITISDGANLLPPTGSGGGYKIGISSTASIDVVINSIVRIDRPYSPRS